MASWLPVRIRAHTKLSEAENLLDLSQYILEFEKIGGYTISSNLKFAQEFFLESAAIQMRTFQCTDGLSTAQNALTQAQGARPTGCRSAGPGPPGLGRPPALAERRRCT